MNMKNMILVAALSLTSAVSIAAPKIGAAAPDFSVADATGKMQKLSDYKGKLVVLEWYNKDCPYVRKHYDVKNMQQIQQEAVQKGAVWLTVVSSAKGKQGHQTNQEALANFKKEGMNSTALLLDESGQMGKAYAAKTTPHMYLIDEKGVLRYNGAIDSNDSADSKTIATSENYVVAALNSLQKGEKIAMETTKPYGCSVKY